MALRVSLQIDGDSTGAEQAAKTAADALKGLGDQAKGVEDLLNKAGGAAGKMTGAAQASGAANDNAAASVAKYASGVGDLANKALGADNALTKAASGAAGFLSKFSEVAKAGSSFTFLTGAIGLAITVASTFYNLLESRSSRAAVDLSQHQQLISRVTAGYGEAAKKAGEFYAVSSAATKLRLIDAEQQTRTELRSQVGGVVSKASSYGGLGDVFAGTRQVKQEYLAFEDAIFNLQAGFKKGTPDVKAFMDQVGRVVDVNPSAQQAGIRLVKMATDAETTEGKLREVQGALRVVNGLDTEADRAHFNLSKSTGAATSEYDRMTKALTRQIVVQEAEAASVGKSAGEQAKLRAQMLLIEAAQRSGIDPAGRYAAAIDAIAGRFGAAAQKAAEMQIRSNAAFDLSQLGRNAGEQNIAGILRGAYGDNVDKYMNSAIAGTLRFNQAMTELKTTTIDVAQGAFRDFRTELANGATKWEAFGRAGVNALQRIADKLADKAIDNLISNMFGSFLGGGSGGLIGKLMGTSSGGAISAGTLGGTGGILGGFYDVGGFTGRGQKYEPAGIVHRGEFVFDAEATRAIGVGNLDAMHRAARRGGYADGGPVGIYAGLSRSPSSSSAGAPIQIVEGDTHITVEGSADEKTLKAFRDELDTRDRRRRASFLDDLEAGFKKLQADWRVR